MYQGGEDPRKRTSTRIDSARQISGPRAYTPDPTTARSVHHRPHPTRRETSIRIENQHPGRPTTIKALIHRSGEPPVVRVGQHTRAMVTGDGRTVIARAVVDYGHSDLNTRLISQRAETKWQVIGTVVRHHDAVHGNRSSHPT